MPIPAPRYPCRAGPRGQRPLLSEQAAGAAAPGGHQLSTGEPWAAGFTMIPCPGPRASERGKRVIRLASLGVLTLMPACTREPEDGACAVGWHGRHPAAMIAAG